MKFYISGICEISQRKYMVAIPIYSLLQVLFNQGVNSRFYHGFQCEDHVGRICTSLCISQKVKLENTALETWYIGLLDINYLSVYRIHVDLKPWPHHSIRSTHSQVDRTKPTWLKFALGPVLIGWSHRRTPPRAKRLALIWAGYRYVWIGNDMIKPNKSR